MLPPFFAPPPLLLSVPVLSLFIVKAIQNHYSIYFDMRCFYLSPMFCAITLSCVVVVVAVVIVVVAVVIAVVDRRAKIYFEVLSTKDVFN